MFIFSRRLLLTLIYASSITTAIAADISGVFNLSDFSFSAYEEHLNVTCSGTSTYNLTGLADNWSGSITPELVFDMRRDIFGNDIHVSPTWNLTIESADNADYHLTFDTHFNCAQSVTNPQTIFIPFGDTISFKPEDGLSCNPPIRRYTTLIDHQTAQDFECAGLMSLLCSQFDRVGIPFDMKTYIVQNNVFNGANQSQCINIDLFTGDFTIASASHNRPTNDAPASFPSIFIGCHWGDCTNGDALPKQINTLSAVITQWQTTQPQTGIYNATYDIWINQTLTTTTRPNGTEIMVWLNKQGDIQPSGVLVESSVVIGNTNWDVWIGEVDNTPVVSYVRTTGITAVHNFDLKPFISDAAARDCNGLACVQLDWYLIGIEAGFEIWQGGTGLESNAFSIAINPNPQRTDAWQITEIYIATLGYAPDNEGLQYWINNVQHGGWTATTVAQAFFDDELVQTMYPAADGDNALIEALYQHLFGRTADEDGKTYWLNELNTGHVTRNQMIIALINGGWTNPQAAIDMVRFGYLVEIGLAFATAQADRGIIYTDLTALQQLGLRELGAQILDGVSDDPATRDAAIARIPELLDRLELMQ